MEKSPLSTDPKPAKPFWSWDIKLLVLVNIVFLVIIGVGLVTVFKALKPSLVTYTENSDLLK